MRLVNCTPHGVCLRAADGTETTIEPSGTVARVSTIPGTLESVPGVPVPIAQATVFGGVEGLPEAREGVLLIVSALVLSALKGSRPDLVGPGTGPNDGAIRNDRGQVVAVTRLVRG